MSAHPPFPPLPYHGLCGFAQSDCGGDYYDNGHDALLLADFDNWGPREKWDAACMFAALWRDEQKRAGCAAEPLEVAAWDDYRRALLPAAAKKEGEG